MVSIRKIEKTLFNNEPYVYAELIGLSTDEKPTELEYKLDDGGEYSNLVANGSIFIEEDTLKIFFFDLDSETWINDETEPTEPTDPEEPSESESR